MSIDFNNTPARNNDDTPLVTTPAKRIDEVTEPKTVESFAEVALRLGGASADEAKRTGVVDTADDQVEDLFAEQYKTTSSPIHRAVWDCQCSDGLVLFRFGDADEDAAELLQRSLEIVRSHRDAATR